MKIDKEKQKSIIQDCLKEGLKVIRKQKKEDKGRDWNWTFEHHSKFPTMSFKDNGLPSFFLNDYFKIDYSKFLTKDKKYLEIKSWKKYYDFIVENKELREYFEIVEYSPLMKTVSKDTLEFYSHIYTYFFLADFVDSFIHLNSLRFNNRVFTQLFEKYYNSITINRLEIIIVVPIIFLTFDFDEFKISETISIKRIEEEIQLSRNNRQKYNSSAHDSVIGAATHAFYLNNWFIDNNKKTQRDNNLIDINAFDKPKRIIENLFASLRLVLSNETGYYQILSIPVNWQYNGKAELPEIFVTSKKKYPDKFENYGWNNSIPLINKAQLLNLNSLFEKLSNDYFSLAIKRLNSAFIRKNDEDSIIDITIALESLLTNDSNSEITYRLSTRVAQLCKLKQFKDYSTQQVFNFCKKIYSYRSAVVHGDIKRIKKTRKIIIEKSKEIEIIEISTDLLKHIIIVMMENNISSTKEIDELMMKKAQHPTKN